MTPSVSVVIPCHNRRALIGAAIASALAQGPDVEVIVVDDGSTDGSSEEIAGFADRIVAVRTDNRGVSAARNEGLAIARGDFIRFLDSDDLIPEGALVLQLEAAAGLPGRTIGVGDAVCVDAGGGVTSGPSYGFADVVAPGPISRSILLGHVVPPVLPLFPAAALREVGGFDTSLGLGEDHELAIRLLAAGWSFARVPLVVCQVREHEGPRLSRRFGAAGYRSLLQTYRQAWKTLSDIGGLSGEEKAAFGKLIWRSARDAAREGLRQEADALFDMAGRVAGAGAWDAGLPLRLLYRVTSPGAAERLAEAAKRVLGRSG